MAGHAVTAEPRRGEIWLAELDKRRPVVVLTREPMGRILNSVIVGPVTALEEHRNEKSR